MVTGGSWEGVGVQPDVAVPAALALSRAHRLAVERLIARTRDPLSRSQLEAAAMKLESIAEAESGEAARLPNAQLVGTYVVPVGEGPSVTIVEQDRQLVQRLAGAPDVPLVLVGGNRYRLEGFPEGYFSSFRLRDGKSELLREAPGFLSRICERRAAGS